MKINEVVNEGIWDTAKKVGAGIKGAGQGLLSGNPIQGAKAGAAASLAKSQQQDLINRVAQKAITGWSTQSQTITASGKQPTPDDLAAWWKGYTKGSAPVGQDNPLPTNLSNNAAVIKWLNKEVANYMAAKAAPQDVAPAGLDTKSAAAGAEVDTPAQGKVTKREDGKWYNEQGQQIVDPNDVAELEKRVAALEKGAEQPATPEQPPASDETITIGGQKLNPKNPKDAELIKKLQGQMQQTAEPAAEQPAPTDNSDLPDVSKLTPEERAELRKQLTASMQVTQ